MTALLLPALLAGWWMLRADARPLAESWQELQSGWQSAASGALGALRELREREMARLSPLDAGPESRAKRAGARLAHGPVLATHRGAEALEPATATRSEETVHSASRRAGEPSTEPSREPSGPRSPEAAPPPVAVSEPAPPAETVAGSTGGLEVDADPDGVGDTLSGLSPEDFRDALDAGGGVEVRADAGALRTDLDADLAPAAGGGEASARVAAPGASTELGASASLGPGTALDAGAALAAGPAGAGVGVRAGPGQLGAVVNASGTPVAVDLSAHSGGVALDVSTGGLVSGDLGSQLPVDLPLELRLH